MAALVYCLSDSVIYNNIFVYYSLLYNSHLHLSVCPRRGAPAND